MSLEQIIHIAEFRAKLRAFLAHTEAVARSLKLTPQRFLLLLAIEGAPDGSQRLNVTELATRLGLSANTVTELCGRAEMIGLIGRAQSSSDQRVVYFTLTKKGRTMLHAVLRKNDASRHELQEAFQELKQSFDVTETWPRKVRH